jgi:hypothetical protein
MSVCEQDQLRDLITEIRGEENTTGCVEYDRFEKVIVRVFTDDAVAFKRDTDEKILRAFRAFDPEVCARPPCAIAVACAVALRAWLPAALLMASFAVNMRRGGESCGRFELSWYSPPAGIGGVFSG